MFKTFSFKKQLKYGDDGEDFFIKCYHKLNPRKSSSREADIIINDKEKVELKSDRYTEEKTENFFIELIGNTNTGKLGGAHLSVKNDIDFFVYHYVNNRTFYWFRPSELVSFVNSNKDKLVKKEVRNIGWASLGVLVPRNMVKHLVIRKDKF